MLPSHGTHFCTLCHKENVMYKVRDQQPAELEYNKLGPLEFVYVFSKEQGQWRLFLYNNGQAGKALDIQEVGVQPKYLEDLKGVGSEDMSKESFILQNKILYTKLDLLKQQSLEEKQSLKKQKQSDTDRREALEAIMSDMNDYHFKKRPDRYIKQTENAASEEVRVVVDNQYIVTFPAMITHYLNISDTKTLHNWQQPWLPDQWFLQAFLGESVITFPATKEQLETLPEYKIGYLTNKSGNPEEIVKIEDVIDTHGGDANLLVLKDEKNASLFKVNFGSLGERVTIELCDAINSIIALGRRPNYLEPVTMEFKDMGYLQDPKQQPDPAKSNQEINRLLKQAEQKKQKEKATTSS